MFYLAQSMLQVHEVTWQKELTHQFGNEQPAHHSFSRVGTIAGQVLDIIGDSLIRLGMKLKAVHKLDRRTLIPTGK